MKESRSQFSPDRSLTSPGKSESSFTPKQHSLFTDDTPPTRGSFNDDNLIRAILTDVIRRSKKSREEIAEQMTWLIGDRVTTRALNSYTSGAAEQHRWPAQYLRAFCQVVNDWSLMRALIERSGFQMISADEAALLELGREFLKQKRAAEEIEKLQKRLQGVDL